MAQSHTSQKWPVIESEWVRSQKQHRYFVRTSKASKPIVLKFCLEYVMKENIILKSMQACVCVCVCVCV